MTLNLELGTSNWRGAILALLSLTFAAHAQIQQAWSVHYNNGVTNGQHQALKTAIGSDGSVYICGYSQDANSNLDYAVLKYAASGTPLWVSRFGLTNVPGAKPTAFSLDPSNNTVVTGNAGTIRLDSNGNRIWQLPYAGLTVATDPAGCAYVGGYSQDFGVAKLSPSGSNIWTTTYVRSFGPTISQAVLVDSLANVYVSGLDSYANPPNGPPGPFVYLTTIKYNSNGIQMWKNSEAPAPQYNSVRVDDCASDSVGHLYLTADFFGQNHSPGSPFSSIELSESTGQVVWSAGDPTGDGYSLAHALAPASWGNLIVAGMDAYDYPNSSYGTYKIGTNGSYMWGRVYPANPVGVSVCTCVTTDSTGNAYVSGHSPTSATSNDIVTIAYDTNGKQLWLQRYDGPAHGDDEGNAIAVDSNGNVYVAGYDTPIGGGTEMVLIKYSPVTARHEANGNFQLEAQGAANEPFDIRATTNLSTWQDLGLFDADTNGLLQFTDTNASQYNSRFYLAIPK